MLISAVVAPVRTPTAVHEDSWFPTSLPAFGTIGSLNLTTLSGEG